jgi:hypothetical protein
MNDRVVKNLNTKIFFLEGVWVSELKRAKKRMSYSLKSMQFEIVKLS